jgi:hypothetical protein
MTAQEYIDKLPKFEWLTLAQVDKEIYHEVFTLLQLNQFEHYRIGWYELQHNLFMKVSKTEKEQLLRDLAELERGLGTIDWVYISTHEGGYVVSLWKNGKVRDTGNVKSNTVFPPNIPMQEYFEWIYKHGKNIKIKYLDEKVE